MRVWGNNNLEIRIPERSGCHRARLPQRQDCTTTDMQGNGSKIHIIHRRR